MDNRHGRRSAYLGVVVFVVWSLFSVAAYAGVTVIDHAAQEQLLQQERERKLHDQQESTPDVRLLLDPLLLWSERFRGWC